jgi:DNA-binding transcriptional regulator YiaG
MFLSRKASRARQRKADETRRKRLEIVKALANYSMKAPGPSVNPREIRRKLGLNQKEFWTCIGVTQSGGSRYENGRKMPTPVREMLRLIHVEHLDLSKIKKEDFDIIDLLKSQDPELYQSLRKALRVKLK